jgi:hypothetical protein
MSSSAPAGSGPNDKNEEESPYMPSQDTITALGSGSWAELMMKQERPRMPVDRLINQTMQQAKAKNMNKLARSYRYRVEGVYSSEAEANLWLAAAARADKARLESQFDTTLTEVCADALAVVGRAEPWANWTLAIGVQCHRHWSGFEPESVPYEGDRGEGKATVGQEQRMYYYTPAPMLRRRGARMEGGIWGSEDMLGTHEDKADRVSQMLQGFLHEAAVGDGTLVGHLAPMECRSVVASGQRLVQGRKDHIMSIVYEGQFTKQRILAIDKEKLDKAGFTLVSEREYKQRLESRMSTLNQDPDAQEAVVAGRKWMLWKIPNVMTQEVLEEKGKRHFTDSWNGCTVTTSRAGARYAWYILDSTTKDRVEKAWQFEHQLQANPGYQGIRQSQSLSRIERMTKDDTFRKDKRERELLAKGIAPRAVFTPQGMAEGSEEEAAWMDRMADSLTEKLAGAVAEAVARAIKEPVMVALTEAMPTALEKALPMVVNKMDQAVQKVVKEAEIAQARCTNRVSAAAVAMLNTTAAQAKQAIDDQSQHGRRALDAHGESMMEELMDQMKVMMDERMGTLATTWEQRIADTVLDTQREHMEETMSQVFVQACQVSGVTFGWKDLATDSADKGSGGAQRADGPGGGAPVDGQVDHLEKTMVQEGYGLQRSGTEGTGEGDGLLEEGELEQAQERSQFADNNIYGALDEHSNSSKSRSRGDEAALEVVPVVSKAMKGPDGKPAATEVVQPYARSDGGQMQLEELDTSQSRTGAGSPPREGDFH